MKTVAPEFRRSFRAGPTNRQRWTAVFALLVVFALNAPTALAQDRPLRRNRATAPATGSSSEKNSPLMDDIASGEAGAGSAVPLKYPFPKLKKHGKETLDVDFAHLACFDFESPHDPALQRNGERKRIPWEVVALDGQLVRVRGFIIPTKQSEEGRATECVIVRNTMVCCFGKVPAANEWVLVKVKHPGAVVIENVPLFFYGRLHVGEIYENGAFAGLYRLECDKVTLGE